ncbi:MAG: polyprenyl synthetase family protein [Candidatus Pristimantibacillus sp.]
MMEDCIPVIKLEMLELVERYFTAEPLLQYAKAFLHEKHTEPMKFGILTVLHYRMFGGEGHAVYRAAAAVEFFILASDILDDLQDGDAPNQLWSRTPLPYAMHIATAFMSISQQAMIDCQIDRLDLLRTMEMMNKQLLKSANGQMIDLVNGITDEQSYMDMVMQKSASLIVQACMTGVMLTGREWHPGVAEYASEVGMAAQIKNDIRDLLRWDDKNDFLQRKKTVLTLYLLEELSEQDRWISDYFEGRIDAAEIADKRELLEQICESTGTMLYGSVRMRIHYNRFKELLDEVPEVLPYKEDIIHIFSN